MAELKALVQFDLGFDLRSDGFLGKDIGEVTGKLVRVDLLDLTS